MKYSWTDSEKGRQFWSWDAATEEWIKGVFVPWDKLKV